MGKKFQVFFVVAPDGLCFYSISLFSGRAASGDPFAAPALVSKRATTRVALRRKRSTDQPYDTTLSGATLSASRLSPIALAMNRAVIGVPS
jgi:hypothetical protein